MQRSVRKKTNSKTKSVTVKKATKPRETKKEELVLSKSANGAKGGASKARSRKQRERIIEEFRSVVNIPREQLQRWLSTPESQKLRFPDEPNQGKRSGETILKILAKRHDKITGEDVDYMRTVIEFIGPRLSKKPKGDIVASNWRYALMNWGHDPSKPLKRVRGAKRNER